jgi:hypothetical protein
MKLSFTSPGCPMRALQKMLAIAKNLEEPETVFPQHSL